MYMYKNIFGFVKVQVYLLKIIFIEIKVFYGGWVVIKLVFRFFLNFEI